MKITITADMKRYITIAEMPIVKRIITECKIDYIVMREPLPVAVNVI